MFWPKIISLFSSFMMIASAVADPGRDRLEIYEVQDKVIKNQAKSMALAVRKISVSTNSDGTYSLWGHKLGPSKNLCQDEPYYHDLKLGYCSTSLVAPDLLLTAAHCVEIRNGFYPCKDSYFVFDVANYQHAKLRDRQAKFDPKLWARATNFTADQVYSCKKVVAFKKIHGKIDYALIQLDRPVVKRTPVQISSEDVSLFDFNWGIYTLGFPAGIPLKYTSGIVQFALSEKVSDLFGPARTSYAVTNIYAQGGNSGGPVFDKNEHKVVGVVMTRRVGKIIYHHFDEYEEDHTKSCQRYQDYVNRFTSRISKVSFLRDFVEDYKRHKDATKLKAELKQFIAEKYGN